MIVLLYKVDVSQTSVFLTTRDNKMESDNIFSLEFGSFSLDDSWKRSSDALFCL